MAKKRRVTAPLADQATRRRRNKRQRTIKAAVDLTAPEDVSSESADPPKVAGTPTLHQSTFMGVAAEGVARGFARDLALVGVAGKGIVAGEAPSVTSDDPARLDWNNRSSWDAAVQIANSRRKLSAAVLSTVGAVMPPLPVVNNDTIMTPLQEVPGESRPVMYAGVAGSTAAAVSGRAELALTPTSPAADDTIKQKLSTCPTDIRDAAYALAAEFAEQVEYLKRSRPNDAPKLAAHKELEDFFGRMASGLEALADALDQAISKGANGQPEPVFLGTAARVAGELHLALVEWLEDDRTMLIDVPVRVGIFSLGMIFLHSIGADSAVAIGALTTLVLKRGRSGKSSGRKSKKRATK